MKQRIVDKLRDSGGVTILMALFAMLVASLVCIVILGASVTAAKQSKIGHDQAQNTLTLQSVGELVRSEIINTGTIEFVGTQTEGTFIDYSLESAPTQTSLSDALVAAAESSLESSSQEGAGAFTVNASSSDPALEESYAQPEVKGSFVLRDDPNQERPSAYQLIVTLSVPDPNGNTPQYLFLKVECTRTVDAGEVPGATFAWGDARFTLAGEAGANG